MKLFVQVLVVVTLVAGEARSAAQAQGHASPPYPPFAPLAPPPAPPSAAAETPLSADEEAARNARYSFSSDVDDHISDLSQHRDEERDGLKVKGSYSYSDGFFWRKVVYEADENGYRIVSDEMVPLEGPNVDPDGSASVHTVVDGAETNYTLTTPQKKTDTREANEILTTQAEVAAPESRS